MVLAIIIKPIPPKRPVSNLRILLLSLIPKYCVKPSTNAGKIRMKPIKKLYTS